MERVLTVSVFLAFCTATLLLSHCQVGGILFLVGINVLVAAGLWEFYLLARKKGRVSLPYGIFCGAVYTTAVFFTCPNPVYCFPECFSPVVIPIACFAMIFLFFGWRAVRGDYGSILFDFGALAGGLVFVGWLSSFFIRMNYFPAAGRNGTWWLLTLIVIAGGADTFAMYSGKAFGKRKFSPRISPNKTVEGFVGGTVAAVLLGLLCKFLFPLKINVAQALITATTISLISHLGDLAESALKRDAGVKDSGRLPGVGGVLDLMDSALFTAPLAYFFMRLWLHT
jgi:phosphatidate cytidylyltransferase